MNDRNSDAAATASPAEAAADASVAPAQQQGISRRGMLLGAGSGIGLGVLATLGTQALTAGTPTLENTGGADGGYRPLDSLEGVAVDAHGAQQAGIARPRTPQRHALFGVFDIANDSGGTDSPFDVAALIGLQRALTKLSAAITACTAPSDYDTGLLPDGPGDLTISVGLGPRVIAAIDPTLPGAEKLPRFVGDEAIDPQRLGGDVLLVIASTDAGPIGLVLDHLHQLLAHESGATLRYTQRAFRGAGTGTVVRNPLGFDDGIIVPRGKTELRENVWIESGPLAGATICVIRRLRLDVRRFRGESLARQEAIIGRHRDDGTPLSGGEQRAPVNLIAKTPAGEFLTPARSHARAAHPSFTGSALMLRRGYAFDDGLVTASDGRHIADAGQYFVCFQRDLRSFVQTQHRLDEGDDLMAYAQPSGSATFVMLPGFTPTRPLGAALFASGAPS